MSDTYTIERANKSEYTQLMDLLDTAFCFEKDEDKFLTLLPKLYKEEYKPWENNIVVRTDEGLKAATGLYYSTLNVLDEKLLIGGIGNVAVHPDSRGKGYMKDVMRECIADMKKRGADFSYLGGHRQRYQYFSYEYGGLIYIFHIAESNIRHVLGQNAKSRFTARELTAEDSEILNEIDLIHRKQPQYCERDKEAYFDILRSWRRIPFAVFEGDEFKGYFIVSRDYGSVGEFDSKAPEDLTDVLLCAFEHKKERRRLYVDVPPYRKDLLNLMHKISGGFDICHSCMYTIFNYKKVLRAYLKLKNSLQPLAEGKAVVLIHGEAGDERLKLEINNGEVTVSETDEKEDIELSHLDALSVFTGLYSDRRAELPPAVASWFPLPLFIHGADNV